jgi:segregation and condensation protein B
MNIAAQIEAVLFWKAEPVSLKKLATLLEVDSAVLKNGLTELRSSLNGRGLTLVETADEVMLGTAKELSPLIEKLTKEELAKDLGKAGLETLSIILYQGPISRADIDYIRGVNSQFILRNLLIRGLVERVDNPQDARSFLYKTTIQLLSELGLSKIEDLPEYETVKKQIEEFKVQNEESGISPPAGGQESRITNQE